MSGAIKATIAGLDCVISVDTSPVGNTLYTVTHNGVKLHRDTVSVQNAIRIAERQITASSLRSVDETNEAHEEVVAA